MALHVSTRKHFSDDRVATPQHVPERGRHVKSHEGQKQSRETDMHRAEGGEVEIPGEEPGRGQRDECGVEREMVGEGEQAQKPATIPRCSGTSAHHAQQKAEHDEPQDRQPGEGVEFVKEEIIRVRFQTRHVVGMRPSNSGRRPDLHRDENHDKPMRRNLQGRVASGRGVVRR